MRNKYLFIIFISYLLLPQISTSQIMSDFDEDTFVLSAEKGDIDAVKRFLDGGMNINDRNQLNHTALMRSVYGGHLKVVKYLIDKDADINLSTGEGHTALYFAVIKNSLEIAKFLIGKGANLNIEFDDPNWFQSSLVFTAMVHGYEEMADILIASGGNSHDKQRYLLIQLYQAFSDGDEEAVKELISQKNVIIDATNSLLLRYASGSAKTRELIRKYGPSEIKGGERNLLDALLKNEVVIDGRFNDPEFEFPLATTYIQDEKQHLLYAPDKAFDGELSTSWVEGIKGSGAGQKIAFEINKARGLSILPGFGKDIYFKKNNRIKKVKLSISALKGDATMTRVYLHLSEILFTDIIEFKDEMSMQEFLLPDTLSGVVVLEILDVYPGEKWDDTCIAEIKILQ